MVGDGESNRDPERDEAAFPPLKPDRPHDALFQWAFSNVDRARAELRAIVPQGLSKKIDWRRLELVSAGTADAQLKHFGIDTLYRTTVAGRPALLYLSLEHQSSVDKTMPIRKLGYWVRVVEWAIEQRKGDLSDPLPIVIPIVLYHGHGRWNAATSVQELFDAELMNDPDVAPLVPRFSFLLDDLTELSDEALRARSMDLATTVVLWALRDARIEFSALFRSFERWGAALQQLHAQGQYGADALRVVLWYIILVNSHRAPENFDELLAQRLPPETRGALMTLAEQLEARGEAKGEAKGRAEGERTVLVRLLQLKFGELDEASRQRVASAVEDQLLLWSERVLTAGSLAEVFGE